MGFNISILQHITFQINEYMKQSIDKANKRANKQIIYEVINFIFLISLTSWKELPLWEMNK